MATRATLRALLRQKLGDAAGAVWSDSNLNDALGQSLREYGAAYPKQNVTTIAAPAGVTALAIPSVLAEGRLLRLYDPNGDLVPRDPYDGNPAPPAASGGQCWRFFSGGIRLAEPASGGTWTAEHLGPRAVPADDVTLVDLIDGHEQVVVALAAAWAWDQQAGQEAVRGVAGTARVEAARARAEAETALRALRRSARMAV